jgi:predicted anti-sigma-YlaC factor YlaD
MMNPHCQKFEKLVDLEAAGWLLPEEDALLANHLQSCASCRQQADAADQIAQLLANSAVTAAPVIDLAAFPAPAKHNLWKWLLVSAAAACLVLALRIPQAVSTSAPVGLPVTVVSTALQQEKLAALSAALPSLATYRQAASLSDHDLDRLLAAHNRCIDLYAPPTTILTHRITR